MEDGLTRWLGATVSDRAGFGTTWKRRLVQCSFSGRPRSLWRRGHSNRMATPWIQSGWKFGLAK